MVLAIFTDIVPLRLRPRYWAAIQVAWAVGTVTGPVIGGACAHPKTWRWIFYINFPICAISLVKFRCCIGLEGFTRLCQIEEICFYRSGDDSILLVVRCFLVVLPVSWLVLLGEVCNTTGTPPKFLFRSA